MRPSSNIVEKYVQGRESQATVEIRIDQEDGREEQEEGADPIAENADGASLILRGTVWPPGAGVDAVVQNVQGEGEEEKGDEWPSQGKNSRDSEKGSPPISTSKPIGGRDHDQVASGAGGEEGRGCLEEPGGGEEEEEGQEARSGTEAPGDAVDERGFAGCGDEGEEDAKAVENEAFVGEEWALDELEDEGEGFPDGGMGEEVGVRAENVDWGIFPGLHASTVEHVVQGLPVVVRFVAVCYGGQEAAGHAYPHQGESGRDTIPARDVQVSIAHPTTAITTGICRISTASCRYIRSRGWGLWVSVCGRCRGSFTRGSSAAAACGNGIGS